jgi:hypothetical protein
VDDPVWYNHTPAGRIRELIGDALWREYYKFCIVRNPFDRVVSCFWFAQLSPLRELLGKADFSYVRRAFTEWLNSVSLRHDYLIYTIEGKVAVDDFIRYETLHADMERVCRHLAIPWEPERLGRFKSEFRARAEHFSEYYDSASIARVRKEFAWDLAYFDYSV